MLNTIIDDRLQELGVTKNYKGYYQLKLAIQLALEDDFRLQAVSKEIYEPVAKQLGCNDYSVERNIRTISRRIWRRNPKKLCEIAKYKLYAEPSASELIAIVVANIQRSQSVIST